MIKPFHLSFVVPDLSEAREFYVNLIGCEIGRDTRDWIDILFFGHQLTLHQQRGSMKAKSIDHFGAILDKLEWQALLDNLQTQGAKFQLTPMIRNKGAADESGKFMVLDSADNVLEFKYYGNFESTVVQGGTGGK